ncbi:MAG: hypothetical protein IT355_05080 [Gemmatimonadaceae bacterium]|nr:hypothetical protein [Gemmatimonadaceae bacterium]
MLVAALLVLVAAAAGAATIWELQAAEVEFRRDALVVRSRVFRAEVPVLTIREVVLLDTLPGPVRALRAIHLGTVFHGRFETGTRPDTAELFLDAARPPFAAVRTAGGLVIFNEDEPERTRARYATLAALVAARVPAPTREPATASRRTRNRRVPGR